MLRSLVLTYYNCNIADNRKWKGAHALVGTFERFLENRRKEREIICRRIFNN